MHSPRKETKKRKDLTFEEKIALSRTLKAEKHPIQREIKVKYNFCLGTMNNLLNFDESSPLPSNLKRKRKFCLRKTKDIDSILYEWFQLQRTSNYTISGEVLQLKAKEVASKIGVYDFKASNGWLQSFLNRNRIKSYKICGYANTVSVENLMSFKEIYENKIKEYAQSEIFNCDESGLFFKQTSSKTYVCSAEEKANGKFSKERVTILFCASMKGEKLKPVLISKAKNPNSLKT
jgi:hypothetical protein